MDAQAKSKTQRTFPSLLKSTSANSALMCSSSLASASVSDVSDWNSFARKFEKVKRHVSTRDSSPKHLQIQEAIMVLVRQIKMRFVSEPQVNQHKASVGARTYSALCSGVYLRRRIQQHKWNGREKAKRTQSLARRPHIQLPGQPGNVVSTTIHYNAVRRAQHVACHVTCM